MALFQSVMAIKGMTPVWSDEKIFGHVEDDKGVSFEQVRDSYYEFSP